MAIPDSHEEMKESNNGKKLFTPAEFDTLILDLKRFIHQSHSPDLKIGGYLKSFGGIPVALSFGKGTPAQVTWLSFKKKITIFKEGHPLY